MVFLVYSRGYTTITTNSSTCPRVPVAPICGHSWLYCALLSLSSDCCLAGGILSYSAKILPSMKARFPLSSSNTVCTCLYCGFTMLHCSDMLCHPTTCMPQCLLNKQKNFKPPAEVSRKWDQEIAWCTTWNKNLSGFYLVVVSSVLGHILTLISISPSDIYSSCFFSFVISMPKPYSKKWFSQCLKGSTVCKLLC